MSLVRVLCPLCVCESAVSAVCGESAVPAVSVESNVPAVSS